jgi:hypothetical protein
MIRKQKKRPLKIRQRKKIKYCFNLDTEMNDQVNIKEALEAVEADLNSAELVVLQLDEGRCNYEYPEEYIESLIERAFTTLLLLSEVCKLDYFRSLVLEDFENAKNHNDGLRAIEVLDNGESELIAGRDISKLLQAFKAVYGLENKVRSSVSVVDVLRNCEYSLTSPKGLDAPSDEPELHERIEAVLRCVYPDLKHKPTITKPIKNFEPDTGIPSVKTLIEYKYVDSTEVLKRVSDEILADTQGYKSKDWKRFIYLIYETKRFQSENKWKSHLVECGNPQNTDVIVIRGEMPTKKSKAKKKVTKKTKNNANKKNARKTAKKKRNAR